MGVVVRECGLGLGRVRVSEELLDGIWKGVIMGSVPRCVPHERLLG